MPAAEIDNLMPPLSALVARNEDSNDTMRAVPQRFANRMKTEEGGVRHNWTHGADGTMNHLDGHDVLFFTIECLADLSNIVIVQFLHLVIAASLVVLGDLFLLLHSF